MLISGTAETPTTAPGGDDATIPTSTLPTLSVATKLRSSLPCSSTRSPGPSLICAPYAGPNGLYSSQGGWAASGAAQPISNRPAPPAARSDVPQPRISPSASLFRCDSLPWRSPPVACSRRWPNPLPATNPGFSTFRASHELLGSAPVFNLRWYGPAQRSRGRDDDGCKRFQKTVQTLPRALEDGGAARGSRAAPGVGGGVRGPGKVSVGSRTTLRQSAAAPAAHREALACA